jgi:hypothetical protein
VAHAAVRAELLAQIGLDPLPDQRVAGVAVGVRAVRVHVAEPARENAAVGLLLEVLVAPA